MSVQLATAKQTTALEMCYKAALGLSSEFNFSPDEIDFIKDHIVAKEEFETLLLGCYCKKYARHTNGHKYFYYKRQ